MASLSFLFARFFSAALVTLGRVDGSADLRPERCSVSRGSGWRSPAQRRLRRASGTARGRIGFSKVYRIGESLLLAAALVLGPITPALAQGGTAPSAASATLQGVVSDSNSGSGVGGVGVVLAGPASYHTATDSFGAFMISGVTPGIYSITASANGYGTQQITEYAVLAGQTYNVTVALQAENLSSLKTIATVSTRGRGDRGSFNVTPASQVSVGAQSFAEQGQSQVMQVLDELPGFYTAHESANNNPAAPGAASYANIRGAQTYETSSMIDGHAVARVGGGYRDQYLNPALFQDVEVVKGPGATVPTINYAIAGSVNFVTLEPTRVPVTTLSYGIDGYGSQTSYLRSTGSLGAGQRFSYAVVLAANGQNGAAENFQTAYPIGQWVNVTTTGAKTSTGGAPTSGSAYVDNSVSPVQPPAPSASNHGLNILNPATVNQNNYGETGLYACCANVMTFNNESAQLFKGRYKFSNVTNLTYTFMGTHGTTDEDGNHLWQANTYFDPTLNMTSATTAQVAAVNAASYPVAVGGQFVYDDNYLVPEQIRHQDEMMHQLDLRTTIGKNGTLLLRGFGMVTTNNATNGVDSPSSTVSTTAQVYGAFVPCYGATGLTGLNAAYGNNYTASCGGSGTNTNNPVIFNGQTETITYGPGPQQVPYCLNPAFQPGNPSAVAYYTSPTGTGTNGLNSKGVQTGVALNAGCNVGAPGYVGLKQTGISGCNNYTGPPNCAYFASNEKDRILGGTLEYFLNVGANVFTFAYDSTETKTDQFYYQNMPDIMPVPPGDHQILSTAMVRGNFALTPQLSAILSLYSNRYMFHISIDNGFSFQDTSSSHFDGRLGLTFRPDPNISFRASAGSSIAPPYIFGILSSGSHIPGAAPLPTFVNQGVNSYYTLTEAAPNLLPETAFGYDVGADFRIFDASTVLSIDTYLENIFNQYLISAGGSGFLDGTANDGTNGTFPLFVTGPTNVARARLMGLEFSLTRAPAVGFGYIMSGALQQAYPFDIPCFVYGLPVSTAGCLNPVGNLAEIPNINYLVPGGGTGVNTGQANVTGTARNSIPYSQGYGQFSYTTANGGRIWFGEQYYGNNNTYNQRAFSVASAGIVIPVPGNAPKARILFSVYNLFNAYPLDYVQQDQGDLIPTIAAQNPAKPTLEGLTNGLNIGPTRAALTLQVKL